MKQVQVAHQELQVTSGLGTSGTSGTSGDGTSGTSGSSGTSGESGTSGTSGNGTSGTSGAQGTSGTSGTSGGGGGISNVQNLAVRYVTDTSNSGQIEVLSTGNLYAGLTWDRTASTVTVTSTVSWFI